MMKYCLIKRKNVNTSLKTVVAIAAGHQGMTGKKAFVFYKKFDNYQKCPISSSKEFHPTQGFTLDLLGAVVYSFPRPTVELDIFTLTLIDQFVAPTNI